MRRKKNGEIKTLLKKAIKHFQLKLVIKRLIFNMT